MTWLEKHSPDWFATVSEDDPLDWWRRDQHWFYTDVIAPDRFRAIDVIQRKEFYCDDVEFLPRPKILQEV